MKIDQKIIGEAADIASKKVAEAFSHLAGLPAKVNTSKAELIPFEKAVEQIRPKEGFAVVVYAQLLSGVQGVSFLTLPRESALNLVDLLNRQPIGTTGILKDIDRSALKEVLNILSNSYMTALADKTNLKLGLGVPNMITSSRLEDIVASSVREGSGDGDMAVVFETTVEISEQKIVAELYILFNEKLANIVNS